MTKKFHLSVVATARNDNHGENFLYRMQHFVDGFIEQCKRHQLSAELIIVEWNPPEETEPLFKALKFPEDKGPCAVRFIRVPKATHLTFKHSDKLPLFQMIAKNVGIRRAVGKFVLATNIDILFSDKLIQYLRDNLKPNRLYRADRLDVPATLPLTPSLTEILDFCQKNYFRINGKYGTKIKINGKWQRQNPITTCLKKNFPKPKFRASLLSLFKLNFPIKIYQYVLIPFFKEFKNSFKRFKHSLIHRLHTNACGDFTLLSYEDWETLKGYPEWEMYSWHIDSVLLHQARQFAIHEVDLPKKLPIYHIEHGVGSGYQPEASDALFKRLQNRGIPHLSDLDLQKIVIQIQKSTAPTFHNTDCWGMVDLTFEEIQV